MSADVHWAAVWDTSWSPTFERVELGAVVRISGPCPRCHHRTTTDFPATIPSKTLRSGEEEVTIYCQCGVPHQNHPEGDFSCGAYWNLTTTL